MQTNRGLNAVIGSLVIIGAAFILKGFMGGPKTPAMRESNLKAQTNNQEYNASSLTKQAQAALAKIFLAPYASTPAPDTPDQATGPYATLAHSNQMNTFVDGLPSSILSLKNRHPAEQAQSLKNIRHNLLTSLSCLKDTKNCTTIKSIKAQDPQHTPEHSMLNRALLGLKVISEMDSRSLQDFAYEDLTLALSLANDEGKILSTQLLLMKGLGPKEVKEVISLILLQNSQRKGELLAQFMQDEQYASGSRPLIMNGIYEAFLTDDFMSIENIASNLNVFEPNTQEMHKLAKTLCRMHSKEDNPFWIKISEVMVSQCETIGLDLNLDFDKICQ